MSKNLLAAAVSAAVLFASPFSAAQADEGVVTVYMPSPTGLNAKYVAQFEKQTGIKVKLFEGTTGKILARLEAEKSNPVADVVVLASWSDGLAVNPAFSLRTRTPKMLKNCAPTSLTRTAHSLAHQPPQWASSGIRRLFRISMPTGRNWPIPSSKVK
jgi:spermidine/putrescine-binding protein